MWGWSRQHFTRPRRLVGPVLVGAIPLVAATLSMGGRGGGEPAEKVLTRLPVTSTTSTTTTTTELATTTTAATVPPTVPATPAPTTTTSPPPPPPPPPAPAPPVVAAKAGTAAFGGLGTWVDVYDWSVTYGKDGPLVGPADLDLMVANGVETLYIQAAKWDAPVDVLEPERLVPLITHARSIGLRVVTWYLPTLEDPAADLRRLVAIANLGVDAVAVDIESRAVGDVPTRNALLIELSAALRAAVPDMAIGAIAFPPVVTEVINPNFWPGFPWLGLAPYYDVWLPMSYQSNRKESSGYRDAYRYLAENIDRLRANVGSAVPIHAIGGIANATGPGDVEGMIRACAERGCVGGSLYDWRTTDAALWPSQQPMRDWGG